VVCLIYLKFSKFQLVLVEIYKFLNYQISDVKKLSKLNLLSKMHLHNRLPTYMNFWKENLQTLVFIAFLVRKNPITQTPISKNIWKIPKNPKPQKEWLGFCPALRVFLPKLNIFLQNCVVNQLTDCFGGAISKF
jgi:hypothetical protein